MIEHYHLAIEAVPVHIEAGVALLGHLADAGEWGQYMALARRFTHLLPDDPRGHLFLGLGLQETGRSAGADSAFERALARLSPADRRQFEDITMILEKPLRDRYLALDSAARAESMRAFFAAKDPSYLTPTEERRLEHYTRMAWAELKFGSTASGMRGWDSDRGRIWVRYGPPWRWYQCCYGSGSRAIYWSYGEEGPLFVFNKSLTYRRARLSDVANQVAAMLEETGPEIYRPRTITTTHDLPHQLARFRGSSPELTKVEIFAQPPLDSLGAQRGDTIEAGVFLFDVQMNPAWERRHQVGVADRGVGLTYRAELAAGEYRYGLEARLAGPDTLARPLGRSRDRLTVTPFPVGRVSISDLLLADLIRPTAESPARRDDLFIAPSRTLRFEAGQPIHLYFEVYGLPVDSDSLAHYRAELIVEDSTQRNLVRRLARGAQEIFRGGADGTRVTWERVTPAVADAAIDYLSIELPALEPGEYVIRVRVTEPRSGETVEARRRFVIWRDME
jgi:GWxTD domain-containing protein